MNKLYICLSLAAIFITVSCCNEEQTLIGTWITTNYFVTSCEDPAENNELNEFSSVPCTSSSSEDCAYIAYTFDENMLTIEMSQFLFGSAQSNTESGNYTIDEDQLTQCIGGECVTTTISINGNIMTITEINNQDGCVTINTFERR